MVWHLRGPLLGTWRHLPAQVRLLSAVLKCPVFKIVLAEACISKDPKEYKFTCIHAHVLSHTHNSIDPHIINSPTYTHINSEWQNSIAMFAVSSCCVYAKSYGELGAFLKQKTIMSPEVDCLKIHNYFSPCIHAS